MPNHVVVLENNTTKRRIDGYYEVVNAITAWLYICKHYVVVNWTICYYLK